MKKLTEKQYDIIFLAQGYLGVLVMSVWGVMSIWNVNSQRSVLIMKKTLLPVIEVMDITEISQQHVIKKWRLKNEI